MKLMLNEYLLIFTGGDIWRPAKFTNPPVGATVEAFADRDGKRANTITETETMLRGRSFPMNDGD